MISSPLLDKPNIRHGFFTRKGGCSNGIYRSLNCGPGSDDNPENITKNRDTILTELGSESSRLCGLYQIHSNIVHDMDIRWDNEMPKGDAVVTNQKNIALGILTADCAPVLFADSENGVIGAAHAGWQGALTGILENTVQLMCRKGADIANICATVGPCIAQENYEVGPEFREKFTDQNHFFRDSSRINHYLFDLKAFVHDRLEMAGLGKISILPHDTYADEDNFFSYRRTTHRSEKDYGRQISTIILL